MQPQAFDAAYLAHNAPQTWVYSSPSSSLLSNTTRRLLPADPPDASSSSSSSTSAAGCSTAARLRGVYVEGQPVSGKLKTGEMEVRAPEVSAR